MTNLYFLTFRFLLISGFVSLVSILSSQEANTLDISSPARIAGSYRVSQPSDTIAVVVDNLSGMAQFVDACEPIGDDMDGIIVGIAESSECSLLEQVQNILDTDAIGILICHSKESQGIPPLTEEVIGMKGLNVPVFNMSYQECIEIKSEIGSDPFDVLISYSCDGIVVEDVIWGDQQGQGDFSNGLGEWTVVSDGDTSWYWTLDKVVPGRYTADSRVVEGTACNGYMIFPSDFYDNNGEYLIPGDPTDGPNTGAGPCPNQALQSDFCAGSLYSPVIDLSGDELEGLFCRFYHDWGYYYAGSTSLIVSYDGGETWADTTHITLGERADTELNPEVNISGECPPVIATVNDRGEGFYSIPILSYNGQTSIQLQFRHLGGYYHTTIDDVALVAKKQIDIQPVHATAAKAPAAAIPLCQVSEIPLHIGVVNKGNILADNIIAKADVIGPSGNLEATVLNNNYSDKEPFCYEENHPSFSEGFTPTQLGEYHVSYKSVTEGDANQNNDLVSFSFETTERTWRSVDRSIKSSDGLYKHMFSGFNYSLDTKLCVFKSIFAYPFYLPQGEGQFLNSFTFGVNSLESNLGEVRAYI